MTNRRPNHEDIRGMGRRINAIFYSGRIHQIAIRTASLNVTITASIDDAARHNPLSRPNLSGVSSEYSSHQTRRHQLIGPTADGTLVGARGTTPKSRSCPDLVWPLRAAA
jgi:hypothetical protein